MIKSEAIAASALPVRSRPRADVATSDEALLARVAARDRDAMQVLFGRHNVRVFRFVLNIVKDRTLAEEVTSDVFFNVWERAGQFERRSKASTWLLAVARNVALSARRRRRNESELDEARDIEDGAEGPEETAQAHSCSEMLRHCVEKLPISHRQVVDLVYYHDASVEEVAQILAIPSNTVKTRMFHARKKLSDMLLQAGVDRYAC